MSVILALCAIVFLMFIRVYMEMREVKNIEAIIAARSPVDYFSYDRQENGQPYLLLHHNLSGRVYQVFCSERDYLFYHVGGEFKGIDSQIKLLDHIPSSDEFAALPGKNFRIEKQSVDQIIINPKRVSSTYLPASAVLSFYIPKKKNYILLDELTDEQLLYFFQDMRPRVSFDEKAILRREKIKRRLEKEQALDAWRESRQNPRVFHFLYMMTVLLFILEIISCGGIFLCLKSGLSDRGWSFLCILCHAAVVILGLAFPAYFTMTPKPPRDFIYELEQGIKPKSISMHITLTFSGIGALFMLLRTDYFPFWSILIAGLIYTSILAILFICRFRELRQKSFSLFGALFIGLLFCFLIPAQANCAFDFSEPQMTTAVVSKKINGHGIVGVNLRFQDGNEYYWDLSKKQYENIMWGTIFELEMHPGAFHMKYASW